MCKVSLPFACLERLSETDGLKTWGRCSEQLLKECGADPRRWEMATGKDLADFDPAEVKKLKTEKGALIVHNVAYSLEWVLSSPPPLHAFLESPIIVEWPEGEDTHH